MIQFGPNNRGTLDIAVSTTDSRWTTHMDPDAIANKAIGAAVGSCPELPLRAEVSLLFCDDHTIQDLNRTWRGQDKPTNVLSFPMPQTAINATSPLGDIVIAFETCCREAADKDLSLADHATHLIVHGFLHLVGHDHEDDADAAVMESLETHILRTMKLPDPYES